jgi:NADH-quinone oxidoreductase subunit L
MEPALAWIVLGLPLLGAATLAAWPGEPPRSMTRVFGVGPVAVGFLLAAWLYVQMLGESSSERLVVSRVWEWIEIGDLTIDVALQIDPLSVMMMLIITGVGSLIFLYSTEYMEHDRDYRRFFAEMGFFVFSMLLLVLAANFLFLIVGWALVGLASYLLIGFYYEKPSAVAAAKKAFIINVIGDVGMVIAAFILAVELGTLDYVPVFEAAPEGLSRGAVEAVTILLFVGAAAKSAQIPLHTWLPDAMEGPTPVSALIHAATMVTAGVYMIVRTHELYELAPHAEDLVAITGGVTLFLAATIAMVQVDVKRVLAWSTVSQIGYMIMAAGLGAYGASMYHLMTHAFFKALLFLSIGIVIHGLAGEQSLDRMGGLKEHLKLAYLTTAIGVVAISGVPGTSGFFSKDEILASAWDAGDLGRVLWVVGAVASGITAFYMFRLLFRAFHGPAPQGGYGVEPHGSRWPMAAPVIVLAALSLFGGWIQVPNGWQWILDWLEPVIGAEAVPGDQAEYVTLVATIAVIALGAGTAWWIFAADPGRRERLAGRFPAARRLLQDQYRFDHVYDQAIVAPSRELGGYLHSRFESGVVQGLVRGAIALARGGALALRAAQDGLVRTYVFVMLSGVVALGALLAWVVTR